MAMTMEMRKLLKDQVESWKRIGVRERDVVSIVRVVYAGGAVLDCVIGRSGEENRVIEKSDNREIENQDPSTPARNAPALGMTVRQESEGRSQGSGNRAIGRSGDRVIEEPSAISKSGLSGRRSHCRLSSDE